MRHLGSFLLSVVLAPVIWVLAGVGMSKVNTGMVDGNRTALAVGLLALLAAGLAYCPLVLSRLSPVGPAFVAVAFVSATLTASFAEARFNDVVPVTFLGVDGALRMAAYGAAALLAVPLLATVVVPRRWHRYATAEPGLYGRPAGGPPHSGPPYSGQPYSGQPYSGPPYSAPSGYGTPDAMYVPPPSSYPTETEATRPLPPTG